MVALNYLEIEIPSPLKIKRQIIIQALFFFYFICFLGLDEEEFFFGTGDGYVFEVGFLCFLPWFVVGEFVGELVVVQDKDTVVFKALGPMYGG